MNPIPDYPKMIHCQQSPDSTDAIASQCADAWARFAAAALARSTNLTCGESAIVADSLMMDWKLRFIQEVNL